MHTAGWEKGHCIALESAGLRHTQPQSSTHGPWQHFNMDLVQGPVRDDDDLSEIRWPC